IDIHAVPIGIDRQVINRQVVDARYKDGKPSSLQYRKVFQENVMAIFQRDRLVAGSRLVLFVEGIPSPASIQSLAPDSSWSRNTAIVQVLAPDQAVVPVGVAEVLVRVPRRIGLGRVIATRAAIGGIGCSQNRRTLIQKQRDIAF